MQARCWWAAAVTVGLAVASPALAQGDTPQHVSMDLAVNAVQRVKAKYFEMDYAGGVAEADRLLKQFPKSRELAAWRVANLARVDRPTEARAAANALTKANPNDPWGWFATTFVNEYASPDGGAAPVLASSLEAYRRAPTNPTIGYLRAFALANNNEGAHALALIDTLAARGWVSQELRTLQGTAMFATASTGLKTDMQKADSALKLYALARASDPSDPAAHVLAASRLMGIGRNAEAYPLAKRGVELSPLALAAHENYWRAIDAQKERPQAQRDSEALADVESLLQARGNEPTVLAAASRQFVTRKRTDRARELDDRIVAEHPASVPAEWVFVNRYRALNKQIHDTTAIDSTALGQYRKAIWAFVDRPTHVQERLLGDAYRELFFLSDSTTNADTLLRIVRGMEKYEGINPHIVYAGGAIRLAERGRDFAEAERLSRAGLKAGKAKIDTQRRIYETVGDYAHAVDWMSAFMYDALGVVYLRQGRLDDAEKQLTHARELDPASATALLHLGQLAEKRGKLDAAEQLYIKGSLLGGGRGATNPNRASLEKVYRARHGSLAGYDTYVAGLEETDRANRKAEVAKSRDVSPKPLRTFRLKTLDDRVISLDSLRGKVAVINNWGMWCGPCVAEMPELQKLATQYAPDSAVRILTIDNDPNTDELRAWLQKKGYSFTTLIDDGYLRRSDLHTYPTTWFVDSSGRVVFTKIGGSEKLVEEFGWRVEMIRGRSGSP